MSVNHTLTFNNLSLTHLSHKEAHIDTPHFYIDISRLVSHLLFILLKMTFPIINRKNDDDAEDLDTNLEVTSDAADTTFIRETESNLVKFKI